MRDLGVPRWDGTDDLQGRTILLHTEQGLGDTIQFCRYAKAVAARGGRVVFEVDAPLKTLLSGLDGVDTLGRTIPEMRKLWQQIGRRQFAVEVNHGQAQFKAQFTTEDTEGTFVGSSPCSLCPLW